MRSSKVIMKKCRVGFACLFKENRLQFSLLFCLSAENIFCLRYIISQFSCLALQNYSLIIGSLAISSSNIMSFFMSFGCS